MASSSSDFDEALVYTLRCVQQENLTLNEHQVQTVKLLCEGRNVLCGSYRVWQVYVLPLPVPVSALCD